jgi:hypothetical protein
MNLFVLFGDGANHPKNKKQKKTETLHHALRTVMQFPIIFFGG